MVYDLKDKTSRLTLKVFERQSDADPADFRIEAATGRAPDAVVITGWGATRAEALQATEKSWSEARFEAGLPDFDWRAIASALSAVRAV